MNFNSLFNRKSKAFTLRATSGFTLIELLLVIGIIATLAAIVILAINPTLQLTKAQDAKRTSNAREIKSAINQYIINNGYPPAGLDSTEQDICSYGAADTSGCLNLDVLVDEDYLVTLEQDVKETSANNLGYTVSQSNNGFLIVEPIYIGQSGESTAPPVVASIVSVESVTFYGEPQRSMMTGAIITFTEEVDITGNPFNIILHGSGVVVTTIPTTINSGSKTITTLAFSGPQTEYTSLKDGYYELSIDSTGVSNASTSEALDGDADNAPGGNFIFGEVQDDMFYRRYGDINGDLVVDYDDFGVFSPALPSNAGDPNYNIYFDYDSDGDVDYTDYAYFRRPLLKPPMPFD